MVASLFVKLNILLTLIRNFNENYTSGIPYTISSTASGKQPPTLKYTLTQQ